VSKWLQNLIIITSLFLVGCNAPALSEQVSGKDLNLNIIEIVTSTVEVENVFGEALEILDAPNLTVTEQRSRAAAVKVRSILQSGHGSGTYMIAHGRRVVVTAAHVVRTEGVMAIDGRDGETVVGQVVFTDEENDIAFIIVPEIKSRTAIRYRPRNIYNERLIGTPITYTGFPSHHDLLTIRGYIAALEHKMIVTNMFGWFGSSGSGVFDPYGRFVGCVSGIDIGRYAGGFPIPLETIVWVAPVSQINHNILKVRLLTADEPRQINAFPGARAPRRGGTRD